MAIFFNELPGRPLLERKSTPVVPQSQPHHVQYGECINSCDDVVSHYGQSEPKLVLGMLNRVRLPYAEVFDGQQVGPDHLVIDGDLVELHL